jgi:hypothetical protein
MIEARAKIRLADEYDAAQERGEVASGGTENLKRGDAPGLDVSHAGKATQADIDLTADDVRDAREVRDAEKNSPGIVEKTVKGALDEGREPTKAEVRRAVRAALGKPSDQQPRSIAVGKRVADAFRALKGLPPPATVVGYLRGTDNGYAVSEAIIPALEWAVEFARLWQVPNLRGDLRWRILRPASVDALA